MNCEDCTPDKNDPRAVVRCMKCLADKQQPQENNMAEAEQLQHDYVSVTIDPRKHLEFDTGLRIYNDSDEEHHLFVRCNKEIVINVTVNKPVEQIEEGK